MRHRQRETARRVRHHRAAGEAREAGGGLGGLLDGDHHLLQRDGVVGMREKPLLPDRLRGEVADELQPALRRVGERQAGEAGAGAGGVGVVDRAFEIGDAGDVDPGAAQAVEVGRLVVDRRGR